MTLLNLKVRVIDSMRVSQGGLSGATVDIRCILREALMRRATSVVLCHNHPSGNMVPSRQDDELTRSLADACRKVDMPLLDHVIFTEEGYYSYADKGRL